MNPVAIRRPLKSAFPRDHIIGEWWSGAEEDTIPAGDAAKGYIAAALLCRRRQLPGDPGHQEVRLRQGEGRDGRQTRIGSIYYNRGVVHGIVTVEAIRTAQDKYGKGKLITPSRCAGALENLQLSEARLKELGAAGHAAAQGDLCRPRRRRSGQVPAWDGKEFTVTDWIQPDRELVRSMVEQALPRTPRKRTSLHETAARKPERRLLCLPSPACGEGRLSPPMTEHLQ